MEDKMLKPRTGNLINQNEKYPRKDYMGISLDTKFFPKKSRSITIRKMVNCSECSGESIVSMTFDVKYLKKYIDSKPTKKRNKSLDKLMEALAKTPPPKSWKDKDKE